jgi:hypothetical protein
MTIKSKTIRYEAVAKMEEFTEVKNLLSHLNGSYESYVNDYVIAYVLLKNNGFTAIKINNVSTDIDGKTVSIEFESEYDAFFGYPLN